MLLGASRRCLNFPHKIAGLNRKLGQIIDLDLSSELNEIEFGDTFSVGKIEERKDIYPILRVLHSIYDGDCRVASVVP